MKPRRRGSVPSFPSPSPGRMGRTSLSRPLASPCVSTGPPLALCLNRPSPHLVSHQALPSPCVSTGPPLALCLNRPSPCVSTGPPLASAEGHGGGPPAPLMARPTTRRRRCSGLGGRPRLPSPLHLSLTRPSTGPPLVSRQALPLCLNRPSPHRYTSPHPSLKSPTPPSAACTATASA